VSRRQAPAASFPIQRTHKGVYTVTSFVSLSFLKSVAVIVVLDDEVLVSRRPEDKNQIVGLLVLK